MFWWTATYLVVIVAMIVAYYLGYRDAIKYVAKRIDEITGRESDGNL